MYNIELKRRFVRSYTTSIKNAEVLECIFTALSPFEEKFDKDFCQMNDAEVKEAAEQIVGMREKSKYNRLIVLKEYVNWCKANGVENVTDSIFRVEITGLEKMRIHSVANPGQLQVYLNSLFEPEDEDTFTNTLRCFYWMAFAGMKETDILKVTAKNIDFINQEIKYEDRSYPIYRESVKAFHKCVTAKRFVFKHPLYANDIKRERIASDTLIRGVRYEPTLSSVRTELARSAKRSHDAEKTKLRLSYYRVWISGVFYRAYEMEMSGLPVDFEQVTLQFMEGKTYKLDKGRNQIGAKQRQIMSDYKSDYMRWKAAHIFKNQ